MTPAADARDVNTAIFLARQRKNSLDTRVKGAPRTSVNKLRNRQVGGNAATLAHKVALSRLELVSGVRPSWRLVGALLPEHVSLLLRELGIWLAGETLGARQIFHLLLERQGL